VGYGGFVPQGHISNFLVVMLTYSATLINTLFAGLLFTKFVTPNINIQFSDVMTLCNVNGVPCLSFRVGNADGPLNALTDINVRLSYSFQIPYLDHNSEQKFFRQTERLPLLSDRQHGLKEAWELRHVLDESSPLFGLNFEEHPGNRIYVFTLSIDAVQDLTKSSINIQTLYALEDILIGHSFQNIMTFDKNDETVAISDFSKLSDTEPYPVWYPAKAGAYAKDKY
jgi:inward rectifier potassium channel